MIQNLTTATPQASRPLPIHSPDQPLTLWAAIDAPKARWTPKEIWRRYPLLVDALSIVLEATPEECERDLAAYRNGEGESIVGLKVAVAIGVTFRERHRLEEIWEANRAERGNEVPYDHPNNRCYEYEDWLDEGWN